MIMRKTRILFIGLMVLFMIHPVFAQFTPQELVEREKWEEYLKKAKVIEAVQMDPEKGITQPWKLTLEREGIRRNAVWKDVQGNQLGFLENWKWEIAAYALDKYLGLNMVPPTIERRYWGNRGSIQLWIDAEMSLREKNQQGIATPPDEIQNWNRSMCRQRLFDNLIANEDRHQGNYLITTDWRIILIDHSRTFRTEKQFTEDLIFDEDHPDGPLVMYFVSAQVLNKVKALNKKILKKTTGKYLSGKEINAVLNRRDLVLKEIDRLIQKYGRDEVIYTDRDSGPSSRGNQ
jgi:hypothetical protein